MKMFMSTSAKYEIVLILMLVMLSDISKGYINMSNTTYPSICIHMKEEDKDSPGGDDRRDG